MIHDFRGPTKDYILSELERRKTELRTQLVWIGAQKEPGFTSRTWKWVNGMIFYLFSYAIIYEMIFCFDESKVSDIAYTMYIYFIL